jgi:predicted NBD/HSP70 family sugar kinase
MKDTRRGRTPCERWVGGADAAENFACVYTGAGVGLHLSATGRGIRADHARIARSASAGVLYAVSGIEPVARYLALGSVTLVNLLDLEVVVLAGHGFAHAGERYVSAVRRELASRSFGRANHDVEVRLSPIADDVGAVGAASMGLAQPVRSADPRPLLPGG